MASPTTQSSETEARFPRVALLGRPNVGKSTLFNRLIRKRKSITDPTPGVTRDPVSERMILESMPVVLVDTGGLSESREFIDSEVTNRSLASGRGADIILFLLDVDDVTAEDEEFMQRLRPLSDRIVLVVNKVDNWNRSFQVWDFLAYGFETVMPVSATHGLGIDDLLSEIARRLRDKQASTDSQAGVEDPWDLSIAVLGQPNTGKSTLTNALTGSANSIVSPVAGTTRDVIEGSFVYKDKRIRILDTAGIRRKSRVDEDIEYYSVNRAFSAIEEADVVVLMIDVEKGLVEQDKKIAAQIVKKGRGVVLAANKWDLLPEDANSFNAVSDRIHFLFPVLDFAPIVPLSALKGSGTKQLLDSLLRVYGQLQKRIDTGPLNAAFQKWIDHTPPPQNKTARWKLRYITQVRKNPVQFIVFVNKTAGFPDSYLGFLRNNIRREFGFGEIPISLELRARG